MAEYKLGVDQSNNVKIYTGNTTPTGITPIGSISGLKGGLVETDPANLPDGITATATGDSTKTVKVTLGSGANSQTDESLTITVSGTDNNTITLESNVTREHTGYSVTPGTGKIDIKNTFSAGWKLSGTSSATYAAAGDGDDNVVTVLGLKNAAITSDDYTFDTSKNSNKIITLKASALEGVTSNVDASNSNGFKLAIDDSLVAKTAAETDFMWTATEVAATQSAPASTTMTLTKELNAGWTKNDAANTTTLTYRAASEITYATIYGLAADAKAADMPEVAKNAQVVDSAMPYNLVLTSAVLPTKDGAEVTLTDGDSQTIDTSTNQKPNFSISTTGFNTNAVKLNEYETDVKKLQETDTTATATVYQKVDEYWEPATTAANNEKLTYHTKKNDTNPLAKVTGLNAEAKAGTDVIFNTTASIRTITLKESALDTTNGKTVKLDVSGDSAENKYSLKAPGVTLYDQTSHAAPVVNVNDTTATITAKTNGGWTLGSLSGTEQTLTYTDPADVTLATISNLKSNTDNANIVISGNTVTLKKAALPDNGTVTLAEKDKSTDNNIYADEYDFKLALDTDVDNKYGAGTKTPKLATPANADTNDPYNEPEDTKTVKIYVDDAAGWKVADDGSTVTYTAAGTTDWFKITGLSSGVDITAETGNISLADKVVTIKEAALADSNVKLTKLVADADITGYKLKLDEGVTAPGSKYDDSSLAIYFPDDTQDGEYYETDESQTTPPPSGVARVRGTLVKGWSLTDDENITFTAAQTGKLLAEISGLGNEASDDNMAFGTKADDAGTTDVNEYDKNVLYLKVDALAENSNVQLVNKTVSTTDGAATPATLGSVTADIKLSLKDVDDDNKETVTDELGHDHTYAWSLNSRQTDAYYKEGTEKGWTLTDDTHVTYDAEITPASASGKTLLTVSGLKGGSLQIEKKENLVADETISAVTDGTNALLYISKSYVASVAAVENDPETTEDESVAAVPEKAGLVHIDRRILNATEGKAVKLTNADATYFGKYELAPYNDFNDDNMDETGYVPTKAVDKYIWTVDDADLTTKPATTAATYKKVTAEYWALGNDNTTATYHAQTAGETVARITGIQGGLTVASEEDHPDFAAAEAFATTLEQTSNETEKAALEAAGYVIRGSFIADATGDDKLIRIDYTDETDNDEYKPATATTDDPETTEVDETKPTLGKITVADGALAKTNVTFAKGGDEYRLILSTTSDLEYSDPSWAVEGTTATYQQEVDEAGYALTDAVEYGSTSMGTSIIYNEDTPKVLSVITGLKSGITVDGSGSLTGADDETGIEVDDTGDTPLFVLNGNVLGTTKVTLENKLRPDEATKDFQLSIGKGALNSAITEEDNEDLYNRIKNGVNVWRLTKNNKGEVTAAEYKTVKPSTYTLDAEGLNITNTAETSGTTITKLTGLSKELVVSETAPDDINFSSELGFGDSDTFTAGISVSEPEEETGIRTITVLKADVLDKTAVATTSNSKTVFKLAENETELKPVEIENEKWTTNAGTAILTVNTTEGWNANKQTITYYAADKTGTRVVATITGLSASTDWSSGAPTLPEEATGSFKLSEDNFDKKTVTLTNGKKWDGTNFTYGIALDSTTKSATDTAIAGVARWYLKDATTLDYTNIHDAHYEDNDANSEVAATSITYVPESIEADKPIISITNLANVAGISSTDPSKVFGDNSQYYKSDEGAEGTPVAGITISDTYITVGSENVVFKDEDKPLTLGGSNTTYKFVAGTELFKAPVSGTENFKVEGTEAKLYSGDSEGYGVDEKEIGYMAPTYDRVVSTISGIKSGLVAGSTDSGNLKNAVGTTDDQGNFTAAITYTPSDYKFTVKKDALTTNNVTISVKGTLALDTNVTGDGVNLADSYVWKVSGTNATYNKGKNAGWDMGTEGTTKGAIVYHPAAHDTVVATLSNLASGLKVDPSNDQQILDKSNKVAIAFNANSNTNAIVLRSNALTTKNVLLKHETVDGTNSIANSLALYQPSPTVSGGTTTYDDDYVHNKKIAGAWDTSVVAGNKASYTVKTTAGYDLLTGDDISEGYAAEIAYTKDGKVTSTITGLANGTALNDSNKPKETTDDNDETTGTFTFAKTALADQANVKLTNGNGNSFLLNLTGITKTAAEPVWNFNKGTATYTETYAAGSYLEKTEGIEYTYVKTPKTETIFTITGLDKTQFAESPEAGKNTATAVATSHGITLTTKDVAAVTDTETGKEITPATTVNVVQLDPTKVKFAASNVVIKKGTKAYEFDLSADNAAAAKAYAVKDYASDPQWAYNKGTATLDAGTSAGWAYKVNNAGKANETTDKTTLAYAKAKPDIVATIKGLNATNLVLADGTETGATLTKGQIYSFTEDDDGKKTYSTNPVIYRTSLPDGSDPGVITLNKDALVTGTALKDKVKVTLTLPGNATGEYELAVDSSIVEPKSEDNKWSIDTKGVASYQYFTEEGWTLNDDANTLTYAADKTTVLAKISGLTKDIDGSLGVTTYTKNADTGKYVQLATNLKSESDLEKFITVAKSRNAAGTKDLYTFTVKDVDSSNNKADNNYLTTSNVTLTQVDKTSDYEIHADSGLVATEYDATWNVDGKSGKATYTVGKNAGYIDGTGSKAGKAITYVKPTVSKTLATITGLKKDTTETTGALKAAFANDTVIKVNTDKQIEVLKPTEILSSAGDKATTVTLTSKEGYTFADLGANVTGIAKPNIGLTFKSGTLNVVDTATAGTFTMSADNMKIVYNKKETSTVLATVKGLDKTLTLSGNKLLNGTATAATFDTDTITLSKDALANANVTFTLGKGVEDDAYKLSLDQTNINTKDGIMTNTGAWSGVTGWVNNKGTASYKTYDLAYYTPDGKGGYKYTKESKGTTYATITGLNPDADVSSFAHGGEIKLDNTLVVTKNAKGQDSGKNITLKNSIIKTSPTNFTLALDTTTSGKAVTKSDLDDSTYKWDKDKLTVTKTAGYEKVSDTSITYLGKAKEKQLVATLSGIDTSKDITFNKSTGVITLTDTNLNNKNVTLTTTGINDINYTLEYSGSKDPSVKISSTTTTPWGIKGTTATFTGYIDGEGTYKLAESGKSITYTKANGTDAKPKALMTIKGVTAAPTQSGNTVTVAEGSATLSSGLLNVSYGGTNITGSKDADTIKLTNNGSVTVNGGKGDDSIDLGSATATIVYANGDGYDVITNFSAKGTKNTISIPKSAVAASDVTSDGTNTTITVGKGAIQLKGYTQTVTLVDKNGSHSYTPVASSSDLLIDDNYSPDAAALSDIVEPFHASYTPYDFESGLDLVKQNAFAPALTYTGNDKK